MTSGNWHEVKRKDPCPICSKPDWCGRSDDGAIRCMRIAEPPSGWRPLKTCTDGGTVFRPADEPNYTSNNSQKLPKTVKARLSKTFPTVSSATASVLRMIQKKYGKDWVLVDTFIYANALEQEVACVLRLEPPNRGPKKLKQFRPIHCNNGNWSIGDPAGQWPLYCLADLNNSQRIFIVEGEGKVKVLRSLGLVATTSAHGSKSAAKTDWQPLAGKEIEVIPDTDKAGDHYAKTVTSILHNLDPPAKVRILNLPGLPTGSDIVDFIAERRIDAKDDVAILREIEDLIAQVKTHKPERPTRRSLHFRPFPIEVFPEPVNNIVSQAAKAIGIDHSFIALPLLSVMASAIGNTRRIQLKRGWTEPAILWTAVVGESGTLKTPCFRFILKPVREVQIKLIKERQRALEQYEKDKLDYEKKLADWKRDKNITDDPPSKPETPPTVRLLVSDVTVEALAPLLQDNWKGLLLARDELAGWIGSFDRYARGYGGDAAHWLSMHGGETMIVDRKTGDRLTILVPRASVSVTGGIQPDILRRVLVAEHRESGLAARILLAFPPQRRKIWSEADIPPEMEAQLASIHNRLLELQPSTYGDEEMEPVVVQLEPDAKAAWIEYYNQHAEEQCELSRDLSAAWSKLEGYAARLALVIHYIRWAAQDQTPSNPNVIDRVSISAGITLSRWFAHEARRVYSMLGEDAEESEYRRLAEQIERMGGSVSIRNWQRARSHKKSAHAEAELKMLEENGYGKLRPVQQEGRGAPSKVFTLIPDKSDADNNPVIESDCNILSESEVSDVDGKQKEGS